MTHDDVLEAMARAFAENSPCEMTKAEAMAATWAAIRALPPGWVVAKVPEMITKDSRDGIYQDAYRQGHNEALAAVRAAAVKVEGV